MTTSQAHSSFFIPRPHTSGKPPPDISGEASPLAHVGNLPQLITSQPQSGAPETIPTTDQHFLVVPLLQTSISFHNRYQPLVAISHKPLSMEPTGSQTQQSNRATSGPTLTIGLSSSIKHTHHKLPVVPQSPLGSLLWQFHPTGRFVP